MKFDSFVNWGILWAAKDKNWHWTHLILTQIYASNFTHEIQIRYTSTNINAKANTNTLTHTNTVIFQSNSYLFLHTAPVPLLPLPLQNPLKLTNLQWIYKIDVKIVFKFFVTIIVMMIMIINIVIMIFGFCLTPRSPARTSARSRWI